METTETTTTETAQEGLNPIASLFTETPAPETAKAPAKPAPVLTPPVTTTAKPDAKAIPAPEVKAPEKKVEPPVVPVVETEVDQFTKSLTPKSRERFVEFARKEGERIAAEKLKALPAADPKEAERATAMETENKRLLAELRKVGIEESPEFKAKFVERPKEIKTAIGAILDTYEISQDDFFKALTKPGDKAARVQLNELLESVGTLDRVEVADLTRQFQALEKERTAISTDPETAIKVLQQQHETQAKEYAQKLMTSRQEALEPIIANLEKEAEAFFTGDEGKAEKENILTNLRKLNALDLEAMSPSDRAKMLASAYLATPLNRALTLAQAQVVELRAKLDKYESGSPDLGNGRSSDSSTAQSEEDVPLAKRIFGAA